MSNLISVPLQLLEKFPRAPCFGLGFVRKCGAVKAEELCGNGMVLTRLSSGEVSQLQDGRADQTQTHWGRQTTLSQLSKESQALGCSGAEPGANPSAPLCRNLEQVVQRSCACPILGSVQGQAGWAWSNVG